MAEVSRSRAPDAPAAAQAGRGSFRLLLVILLAGGLVSSRQSAAQALPGGGNGMVVALFTGFFAGSNPGLQILEGKLQAALGNDPQHPFASQVFTHLQPAQAASWIASFGAVDHVVLIGHSLGAETAFGVASQLLGPQGIQVDLALCLDFVALTSPFSPTMPVVPAAVTSAYNYHQNSTGFLEPVPAATIVGATRNVDVEILFDDAGITHTSIDCDPRMHAVLLTRLRALRGDLVHPGTGEDVDTLVRVDVLNVPCQPALGTAQAGVLSDTPFVPAAAGDRLTLRAVSPAGTFAGAPFLVLAEFHLTGVTPQPLLPGLASSLNPYTVYAVTAGPSLQAPPFTPAPLPAAGFTFSFCWPPGLGGTSLLLQSIAVSPQTANGIFASSAAVCVQGL